jgi:AcrR family transcriptional regulator
LAVLAAEKGALRKLKPGPGLSREAVAVDQKMRLRLALADLAAESGFDAVTVRGLMRRANISTSTFYNHYDSVEGCFADIVGNTIRGVAIDIEQIQNVDGDAAGALRSALRFLMERLAREPQVARLVFIEAFAAGPRVLDEMSSALGELEAVLARSFALAPRPVVGTTHLAAGLIAGALGIIRRTTLAGRAEELPALSDELTDWMLSVAHEEVVAFFVPRPRPTDGTAGDRLPWIGVEPASRESVADAGRRAIMATARIAATTGMSGLTSARIRKDAGLSRREFERHFAGVEDCFLGAIESVAATAGETAMGTAADTGSWERWTYRAITTLCSIAAGEPDLARLVLLDFTAPGRAGLIRREEVVGRVASHLRLQAPPETRPPELGVTASVCAVWRIAETEAAARRTSQLVRIAPVLAFMVLASRRRWDRSRLGSVGPAIPTAGPAEASLASAA